MVKKNIDMKIVLCVCIVLLIIFGYFLIKKIKLNEKRINFNEKIEIVEKHKKIAGDYMAKGEFENAIKEYNSIISFFQNDSLQLMGYDGLVMVYKETNRWNDVVELKLKIHDLEKTYQNYRVEKSEIAFDYVEIGDIYNLKMNNQDKALEYYQMALSIADNEKIQKYAEKKIEKIQKRRPTGSD